MAETSRAEAYGLRLRLPSGRSISPSRFIFL